MSSSIPPSPSETAPRSIARFIHIVSAAVVTIALLVLLGWQIGSAPLKSVVPGMTTMKANTAIELLLLAWGLYGVERGRGWRQWTARASIGLALLLCALTAAEYLWGLDFRIDNALFLDQSTVQFPGRNAPGTILCFIAIGASFLLLDSRQAIKSAQAVLAAAIIAPLSTLGGYLYGAPAMYTNVPYPVIALNTAIALILLSIGGLFLRPREGLMLAVTSMGTAGMVARRLLPLSVGVPLVVGLAVLAGERTRLYSRPFGSALLVCCCALLFCAAVWWTVTLLWRSDRVRAAAEEAREHAMTDLIHAKDAAESAGRAKDHFLAVLSHELRTPLTPVLATVTYFEARNDLPAELRSEISSIRRNVEAEARLIDDLLDITRISKGKISLRRELLDANKLLCQVVEALHSEIDANRLQVSMDLAADNRNVWADAGRLRQVFFNILANAVKFTPTGAASLFVHSMKRMAIGRRKSPILGSAFNPRCSRAFSMPSSRESGPSIVAWVALGWASPSPRQ